jgi:hypothetical protein
MEIVIPVRKGGLGNQMFQVAAALIVSKETGKQVVLPQELPHIHNVFQLDYSQTVFQSIQDRLPFNLTGDHLQLLLHQGFWIYPGEPGFEPWSTNVPPGPVILHGYFQYYEPIGKYEEMIRSFYRQNLGCQEGDRSKVGIHVRRGDYLKFADVHVNQTATYYQKGMAEIEKTVKPNYVVFSDDIAWCKTQEVFRQANVVFCEEQNEIECLKQMIACDGGFICANSTYSWWAAFLGPHRLRSPCIVPKKWFNGADVKLFPKEWIVL